MVPHVLHMERPKGRPLPRPASSAGSASTTTPTFHRGTCPKFIQIQSCAWQLLRDLFLSIVTTLLQTVCCNAANRCHSFSSSLLSRDRETASSCLRRMFKCQGKEKLLPSLLAFVLLVNPSGSADSGALALTSHEVTKTADPFRIERACVLSRPDG